MGGYWFECFAGMICATYGNFHEDFLFATWLYKHHTHTHDSAGTWPSFNLKLLQA
jgi:hypothetical protein